MNYKSVPKTADALLAVRNKRILWFSNKLETLFEYDFYEIEEINLLVDLSIYVMIRAIKDWKSKVMINK